MAPLQDDIMKDKIIESKFFLFVGKGWRKSKLLLRSTKNSKRRGNEQLEMESLRNETYYKMK